MAGKGDKWRSGVVWQRYELNFPECSKNRCKALRAKDSEFCEKHKPKEPCAPDKHNWKKPKKKDGDSEDIIAQCTRCKRVVRKPGGMTNEE